MRNTKIDRHIGTERKGKKDRWLARENVRNREREKETKRGRPSETGIVKRDNS